MLKLRRHAHNYSLVPSPSASLMCAKKRETGDEANAHSVMRDLNRADVENFTYIED